MPDLFLPLEVALDRPLEDANVTDNGSGFA
jgi:hypothetical protein